MNIIYTGEEMPETFSKSLFLAGPSKRPDQDDLESWRLDAIQILKDKGFDGIVFCPENKNGKFHEDFNYDAQVEWEEKYLNLADCILFWVPRDLSQDKNGNLKAPAFTTNIEFGAWANSGKIVFGCPENAEKVNYLKYYCEKYNNPIANSLVETIDNAMEKVGDGAERTGGERYIPLMIWNLDSFQSWYNDQTNAGNRLDEARLLYSFRPKFKSFVFLWILKAKIYIASEDRFKENEFVLSRPDISSVCLWYDSLKNDSIFDKQIVIIKEFRTPASTEDGFVRELPSGSSNKSNPEKTAASEVFEETGFVFNPDRLKFVGLAQIASTLSSHKSNLYQLELTEDEIKWFISQKDIPHGNIEDSERTFIEVYSVKELLEKSLVDWACLGQILSTFK